MPNCAASSGSAVPEPQLVEASATNRRCSPVNSCSSSIKPAGLLSPFAMWPAFPASDYYGDSAPLGNPKLRRALPSAHLAGAGPGDSRKVPTFTADRLTSEVPNCSPAACWRYAAALPDSLGDLAL